MMDRVHRAVATCDASMSAPVVIFVSKMIPVKKRDITDVNGRPWRPVHARPPPREFVVPQEAFSEGDTDKEDPDSLSFVAFARVLSGTVTPNTPLLVSGHGGAYFCLSPGSGRYSVIRRMDEMYRRHDLQFFVLTFLNRISIFIENLVYKTY